MKTIYTLIFIMLLTISWDVESQIISQYVETDSGTSPKGVEIWNNTNAAIDFSATNLVIEKGVNGGTPSTDVTVDSGTLGVNEVMIIGTSDMQSVATNAGVLFVDKPFSFNGDDALVVKLDGTTTDVFGIPNSDPGSSWSGNDVSTQDSNIGLLDEITSGATSGFSDPSTRFATLSESPTSTLGLLGFGEVPNAVRFTLDNAGASAYLVTDQSSNVSTLNTNNSNWNLESGKRYLINVVNPGPHPLMIRDENDNLLLGMTSGGGSFANDSDVNFITDASTGQFDFTLTQTLIQEVDNYACEVHTNSMNGLINVTNNNINLQVTELFPGQAGSDLTEDWIEITNTGGTTWVFGSDDDLYYDDESADPADAEIIQGITDIQPGEKVIVVLTNDPSDVTEFVNVWGEVVDLSNVEVGFADGSGLGSGGDGATLWLGDPGTTSPIDIADYPDTSGNDGKSYDVELDEFSTIGNASGAVATIATAGANNSVPNIASPANAQALPAEIQISEMFPGQAGSDLTEDWIEISNTGGTAWVSGTDDDLYYDDESADPADAELIQGITDIQPGEKVIVVLTNDPADVTAFESLWGEVVDLSNVEVGFADGSGLGSGGDGATLWLGDPNTTTPIDTANYPDTAANDGQSYDVELSAFSTIGNANGAVATLQTGGDNNVPNIGSPGDAPTLPGDIIVTELFPGQEGSDLTEDWIEITNTGGTAWVSGTDDDLYYDDESADPADAVLIQGITDIQPGEKVIVVLTNDPADVTEFENVWGAVLDLSNTEIGFADGSGLGGSGDGAALWLGDPNLSSPINIANYPDTSSNDGQSYDIELGAFSTIGNANGAVATLDIGGDNNVPNIGSPGDAPQASNPQIGFDETVISVNEDSGTVTVNLSISQAPDNLASVDVSILSGGTAVEGTHYTFSTSTIDFPANSTNGQSVNIPIIDNTTDDSSLFFALTLTNANQAQIGEDLAVIYILDDDQNIPAGDETVLDISYLNSYTVDINGTAEITDYDPTTEQLFVVNSTAIEVVSLADPNNPSSANTIDITSFGASAQSVAIKNGLLAIAVSNTVETDNGFVVLMNPDGTNPISLEVGALPDMLTFSNDGNTLLVANEGEPTEDYSVDPEGSISLIDVSAGLTNTSQADVTNLDFNSFDSQEAALKAAGVRIYGVNSSVSQDLEPEYITVSEDDTEAYVALQENNAYAIIDLSVPAITDIKSFGLKDHSLPENSLDTSDETDFIFDATWPIKGMYMPDGITTYSVNGTKYIITANEGDAREYDALDEERDITDSDFNPDPAVFNNIDLLSLESNLDGINFSNASGDADADGLFEELHIFGGRSFSIYEANTGNQVYDSGNDFAKITAADPEYGSIFNASNSNNNFKNRSDNKGVEPENVIVKEINGNDYAFIILERIGGVMAYDVTDPTVPVFLEYENNRGTVEGADESGDLGPEGIVYIAPEDNATDKGLLILSNEVSATLSIYQINTDTLSIENFDNEITSFQIYPNPVDTLLKIDQQGDYQIYDLNGKLLKKVDSTKSINVGDLSRGIYLLLNENGISQRFIKR